MEREYTVTATKVITAHFTVFAEDEDDIQYVMEDIQVSCFDADKIDQDDWDILEINAKG